MAKVSLSVELAVAADIVWKLIGGFGSLQDWLPYIPKSELAEGGRTRHLATPDGSTIIERLMAFDEKGRNYTYHMVRQFTPFKTAATSPLAPATPTFLRFFVSNPRHR